MTELLLQLKNSSYGLWVGNSLWGYAIFEMLHLMGVALLVGAITLVDLRLLGVARTLPVTLSEKYLLPFVWGGFALVVFSGVSMFITDGRYLLNNPFFVSKLVLIALAGLNAAFFQMRVCRGVAQWDVAAATPGAARLCAVVSIGVWFLTVACGRLIAYPELWF
jgi:hypothetical protein